MASLALSAFAQRPSFPRQYAGSVLAGLQGRYQLPLKGNRLKEGWQVTLVETTRTGNPLDFHASLSSFTGKANLRPKVKGPVIIGFYPSPNGSATSIGYIQDPSVFVNQGPTFGDFGGTRYAAGDFGTSRQMQMSAKLIF